MDDAQGVTDPVRHCVASPRIVDRALGSETTVNTSTGCRPRWANAVPTGIARSEPASMSVAMTTELNTYPPVRCLLTHHRRGRNPFLQRHSAVCDVFFATQPGSIDLSG